jgi:hypothetical protein
MIKITVTIEEVPEKKSELIVGKYIISHSNFGDAYILGIPCKIMSEPYAVKNDKYHDKHIKVMSCITGIEYEIPYDPEWFRVYDTFDEVLTTVEAEKLLTRGYPIFRNPLRSTVEAVRGKNYYPMDNSYTENFTDGDRFWVANKVVTIISKPYMARTPYGDKMWFVIVKTEDGKVGRCLFMEWKLVP